MAEFLGCTPSDSQRTSSSLSDRNKTSGTLCSLQDFALNRYVMRLISCPCSEVYLSQRFDYVAINNEFSRFIDFVGIYPEFGQAELSSLLFPIFVHLYLVLLQIAGDSGPLDAHKFYNQYDHVFVNAEGYEDILKELYALKSPNDVRKHSYFKKFWERKYIVTISSSVLQDLRYFFERIESKALLYVCHFYFHYEDPSMKVLKLINSTNDEKFELNIDYKASSQDTDNHEESISTFSGEKDPLQMPTDSTSVISSVNRLMHFDADNISAVSSTMEEISRTDPRISTIVIGCNRPNICSVDFNVDENELCIALGGSCIFISPLEKQQLFKENDEEMETDDETVRGLKRIDFPKTVSAVKYLPDQPHLLVTSCGTEVKLLDTVTEIMKSFDCGHSSDIWDIDVNSTTRLFATASKDMTSCLWDFNQSSVVKKFSGHLNVINTVKFHPNGIYVATGSSDGTARLWSVENGRAVRSFLTHESEVHSLAFSSDGKILASADSLGIVKIWDIKDGSQISEVSCCATNEPHLARVTSLCFSQDAPLLAACNYKGIMKIWDIRYLSAKATTKYFQNIPLLMRYNKHGVWKMVFKKMKYSHGYKIRYICNEF